MQRSTTACPDMLSPEKQQQILRGAATVFAQEGYEGASMSRIAAQAGVSKGTLYNYFTSKADLFATYVNQECSQKIAAIFDGTQADSDVVGVLRTVAGRMVRMVCSPTGLTMFRIVVSEAERFPDLAQVFFRAGPARATGLLSDWLSQQDQRGTLRVADPVFAAEQFFALCQARLGTLCRLRILIDPSETEVALVVESAVTMFLNTYLASSGKAGAVS